MSNVTAGVVIVGAGHAAGQACASLRQEGFEGPITVLGDEPHIPYQRPPLSKQYLAGEQGIERVYLRPQKFYDDKNVSVKTGVWVDAIDTAAQTVTTHNGETFNYAKLILATGTQPRRLQIDGSDLAGIHYLRTIDDVDGIRADMAPGKKLVIVGGGYIGLEVAAVAVEAGLEVHVLEMEERILQRVTTPEMSAYYHQLHTDHGVNIHTSTMVSGFAGSDSVTQVLCGDTAFDADLVIVGIGVVPNVALAEKADIKCDNGILVDEYCRTSVDNIYGAGDCTNHLNPLTKTNIRLESVPNAMEQARVSASNICGGDKVYDAIPWFWSDQYDLKLQMVGFSAQGDEQVLRGDMSTNDFAVFYLKDGAVIAADAVNNPRAFMVCKQLVGKKVDKIALADTNVDLKTLLS